MIYDDTEDTEPEEVMSNMNQKDKILNRIKALDAQERSDILFFLIGYCDHRPEEFWQGMAAYLYIDIR